MDFGKNIPVRKLWREKANMQISSYKSVRPVYRGRFSSLLRRVILMFTIVDRRYGSTLLALYGSGNVQHSRRINTVYSLPMVYNTVYSIPSTGTYTVPYRFVVSSARAWLIRIHVPYRIPYTRTAYYISNT